MVQRFVCDGLVFKIEDFKKPSLPHMRVFVEDTDFAALEKRCEEAERERDKVRNIVKFLEERLRHYYKVMEKRYNCIEDPESENSTLRKRLEELGKLSPLEQTARSLREGE